MTAYVSTGRLPAPERVRALVDEAYERFRGNAEGETSQVYPALARAHPGQFGLCVVGTTGNVYATGDADAVFTIMSVAKPFVFALVCEDLGAERVRERVGVNATGLPFNSLEAVERAPDSRTNPMVNPGAIATTSLVTGEDAEASWDVIRGGLSRFAGRPLAIDAEVYESASQTNDRNRDIAELLERRGQLRSEAHWALDLYTRTSALLVSARDLATMAATLADGGVNPISRERVITEETCRRTLAVMATAGLYETSGDWLYDVGLPGKSGIGGGIVTVSPGKGGLGTFAPLLDAAGNSVKGQLAAAFLARTLGLDVFASKVEE